MRIGDILDGRFEVENLSVNTEVGPLHRGRDRRTGAHVALCSYASREFLKDAEAAAAVHHGRLLSILSYGVFKDETWIATEWPSGRSLAHRLRQGPLDVELAMRVVTQAAEALAALHAHGVIHRDINPRNILIEDDNARVLLADFGIAHAFGTREPTQFPQVLAPEQAVGAQVDARTDVFALGCVLFECIVGNPPFAATTPAERIQKVLHQPPPHLAEFKRGAPPALDSLLMRLLAKDPAARPRDGREALEAIRAVTDAPAASLNPDVLIEDAIRDTVGGLVSFRRAQARAEGLSTVTLKVPLSELASLVGTRLAGLRGHHDASDEGSPLSEGDALPLNIKPPSLSELRERWLPALGLRVMHDAVTIEVLVPPPRPAHAR